MRIMQNNSTGGDNSNKRCFGTKPKLFRESGDFSGNRDAWKFFRETRDNSGTMQKKIGTSGNVSPLTAFVRVVTPLVILAFNGNAKLLHFTEKLKTASSK